jgi:hypothetical protein
MPVALAAAFAGAAASSAAAGYGTFIAAMAGAAAAVGTAYILGSMLAKPAKRLPSEARTVTMRSPDSPRQIIYGETRVGGVITYIEATNGAGNLHQVVTFAGHEVSAYRDFYFNDLVVPFSLSTGTPTSGGYASNAYIEVKYGATGEVSFPTLTALSAGKWTSAHLQNGCASVYVQLSANADLFPSGPPNLSAVIRGRKVYDPRTAATVWSNNPALCLADFLADDTYGLAVSYDDIDSASLTAAANVCDERVAVVAYTSAAVASVDTTNNWLVFPAVEDKFYLGDKVTISSSTASYPSPLAAATSYYVVRPAATANAGLYVQLAETYAKALAGDVINLTTAGGGTITLAHVDQPRYTLNGSFDCGQSPDTLITAMLSAMAGMSRRVGGKWYISAGAYLSPAITLDEGDLRGAIKATTRRSRRDIFNAVKGKFISPTNKWQPVDFPAYTSATYKAEDNDETIYSDIDLPLTNNSAMAQRIAKITLERMRRQIEVTIPCMLGAYDLVPGDTFMLTNTRFGWTSKVFEVNDLRLVFTEEEVGVDIIAREIDSNVFVWTSTEEVELPAAPASNLPDPFTVGVPGVPSFSELLYETSGSAGVKTRLTISWSASNDGMVTMGGRYQLEYKAEADSDWIVLPNISTTSFVLADAEPGAFDFRVKAVNVLGVASDYASTTYSVVGLTGLPANVSSFSVVPISGLAQFTWALHEDLDVRIGGTIEVRHTQQTSAGGVTWADSKLIQSFDGNAVTGLGALIQGHYLARAQDSTGNYCSTYAKFYADEALATGYTTVGSVSEATAFTGSKVNITLSSNQIQLTNPTSSLTGQYYFPSSKSGSPGYYIDVGSQAVRRFEADVDVVRFDATDLIDTRGSVDTWSTIDGGYVDRGDVTLYAQTTKTHPGSSASVWTDWTPFLVADFDARAARFKVEFESDQATHNIAITGLNVHIKKAG